VIDLAMMKVNKNEFHQAIQKAKKAYDESVLDSLDKAINRLFTKEDFLNRCILAMKISVPKAVLWQNLERLKAVTGASTSGGGAKVVIR